MKTRAALLVVTFCCAAVTWLNLVRIRDAISKQQHEIQTQKESLSTTELDLANLKVRLDKTSADLRQSQNAEASVRREKESVQTKFEVELKRVHQELDRANAELAAQASIVTSEQIAKTAKQVYDLECRLDAFKEENKILKEYVKRVRTLEPCLPNRPDVFPMPTELRGKILTYDPKWQFVVVSVGQEQGARPRGELLVKRNGQLIGWLVIDSVEKDRCIANVKQGWQFAEIFEGDTVMPTHPES